MPRTALIGALICFLAASAAAQSCDLAVPQPNEPIIFTMEQEQQLGNVVAAQIGVETDIVTDSKLLDPLTRMGGRLARALPAGSARPQWSLIDSSEANAYTLPGGRIYVTRKLIALTRSEDELAAVMAHELGHVLKRDPAIGMSRLWQLVLKKNSLASLAEIEPDYHRILDTYAKNRKVFSDNSHNEEKEQVTSDQIGAWLMTRAGYKADAMVEVFERVSERKGDTGSWLSDLFGTTKPEARRLREIVKAVSALPASCTDASSVAAYAFTDWRNAVIEYQHHRDEAVHGLVWQKQLSPPLQGEISRLQFSPDGKHLLAQSASTVYVLSRDPLKVLFLIDAPEAFDAQFTPDSRQIVFYNPDLRVEKWDIASQKRIAVYELYARKGCVASQIAPGGDFMACVEPHPETFFPLALTIYDTATGEPRYSKKNFSGSNIVLAFAGFRVREFDYSAVRLHVSPDGRYIVAASGDKAVALDAAGGFAEVHMSPAIRNLLLSDFSFVGPSQIIGMHGIRTGDEAAVVRFPSGQTVTKSLKVGTQTFEGVTRGDYALLRPVSDYPVGLMDIRTGKLLLGSHNRSMDVYDGTVAITTTTGGVALVQAGRSEALAETDLPPGRLGYVRVASISPDFSLLGLSQQERAGVWDLKRGERLLHVRGVRGMWFADNRTLFALYPPAKLGPGDAKDAAKKKDDAKKKDPDALFYSVKLDTRSGSATPTQEFERDSVLTQAGGFLVELRQRDGDTNYVIEVRTVADPAILWSRKVKRIPHATAEALSGTLALVWPLGEEDAQSVLNQDSALLHRSEKARDGLLVEILSLMSGNPKARFIVDTGKGSVQVSDVYASGDRVVLIDARSHRVLLYSTAGEPLGSLFGSHAMVSPDGKLLAIEERPGQLVVRDTTSLAKVDEFTFPGWIALVRFTFDHHRIGVLTADQAFYLLDIASPGAMAGGDAARQ